MPPLKWPAKAVGAIATLFAPLQDIDVYVEDQDDEVFYLELLRRLEPKGVRLARVFGLGGRSQVLLACASHDFSVRRALFLIDGDFYWVRGENERLPDGVHRLPAYCIENLIAHEDATVEFLFESCGKRSREEIQGALAWGSWIKEEIVPLIELFVLFAVSNALEPSTATVSEGHGKFLIQEKRKGPPTLSVTKVQQRISELASGLGDTHGAKATDAKRLKVQQRIDDLPHPVDVVSGKDFVLPLLRHRCKGIVNQNTTRASLRLRLAQHCDKSRLASIAAALRAAAAGSVPVSLGEPA